MTNLFGRPWPPLFTAPVDTLPKGRDGEAGSVRSKGNAVAAGEAPNPIHLSGGSND